MPILLILIIGIPLIELYFLIQVGSVIGGLSTILLTILTAVVGTYLIRQQGLATFIKAQQNMQQGQLPALEMMEGLVLVISGVMLVMPGFITDTLGFLLLLPPLRQVLVANIAQKFIIKGQASFHQHQHQQSEQDFIEGEFTEEDKK